MRTLAALLAALVLPVSASAGGTAVFFVPHQDDETISMGAALAHACRVPDRQVVVVLVTDGAASRYLGTLSSRYGLTRSAFGQARTRELRDAIRRLCPTRAVTLAEIGIPANTLTDEQAGAVVTAYADLYPAATFWATSQVDRHDDHAALGRALAAVSAGRGLRAREAVQNSEGNQAWTQIASPRFVIPNSIEAERVRDAVAAYQYLNAERGRYAIGWHSVPNLLRRTLADQRVLWVAP